MKKIALTLLSLLTILNVGCNKIVTPPEDRAIVFTGDIYKETTSEAASQSVVTKAGETTKSKTAFVETDKIGVFVVPYKNSTTAGELMASGNYADNVPFIRDAAGKFAPSLADRITFPTATTHVSLYAFAMFHTKFNTLGANPTAQVWKVDVDQSASDGSSIINNDLMTAQAVDVAPGAVPALSFVHRLAMASIAFTAPAQYRGEPVTMVSISLTNLIADAKVDMTDNAVKPVVSGDVKKAIKAFQFSTKPNAVSGNDFVFEAVVVPQSLAAGVVGYEITLTTATTSHKFNCELPTGGVQYSSGNVTKVALRFDNESKVVVDNVDIKAWGDGGSANVDARQPAIMNFQVAADPSTKAATIKYASLVIDGNSYLAEVELKNSILRCSYMQPTNKFGDKLQLVEFQDVYKQPVLFVSANPAINNLNIPGNPTAQGYAEIISKITFN